jgi:antitoxin YefM
MKTISDKQAQANLPLLLEQTADSHEPVQINGLKASAVLVSEEDWRSIEETLFLLSIPGMRESIRDGMRTPAEQCSSELTSVRVIGGRFGRRLFSQE